MKESLRLIQFMIAAMLMLNGILLMLSRGDIWPSVLLVLLPLPLWFVVDCKRWYELPSWAANTIGLSIGAYALYFFRYQATERHLAVVSDMVCYLILTMLLQSKSPRLYWQISILSVLQSVVASVFSLNLQQGVIFIIYIFVVLATLSMIGVHRDQLVAAMRLDRANNVIRPNKRRRLAGAVVQFRPHQSEWAPARFRALVVSVGLLALFSVATGMAVYLAMPRQEEGLGMSLMRFKTTGISRQIDSLEPIGVLQPNVAEALRVKIIDPSTGKSVRLAGDLYLRGLCLEILRADATGWRSSSTSTRPINIMTMPEIAGKFYRQEIVMLPREDPLLFYCLPVTPAISVARDILFDPATESLFRHSPENVAAATPFRYELGLHGLEGLTAPAYSPFLNYQTLDYNSPLNEDFATRHDRLTQFFPNRYPTLAAKAREIQNNVPTGWQDRKAVAEALTDFLANSPDFTYTNDFRSIQRQSDLDPVEDFVANYRTGHCEMYASALCLMLRSLEIPARVVVGYRTSRFNEVANAYTVQEKHAHSWVEAYLAPRHCSQALKDRKLASDGGAWMRLDPTPSASSLEDSDTNLLSQANDAIGYAQSLWDEYVMGIENGTPGPSDSSMSRLSILQTLLDPSATADLLRRWFLQLSLLQRGLIASMIVLGLMLFQLRSTQQRNMRRKPSGTSPRRGAWRKLRQWVGAGNMATDEAHWADLLLHRFETVATKAGYSARKPSATPLEYAGHLIAEIDSERAVKDEVVAVVSDFYALKFRAQNQNGTPAKRNTRLTPEQRKQLFDLDNRVTRLRETLPNRKQV